MRTTGLDALVRKLYPHPEWAVFSEVSNATGSGANRRADAVALGIWPSRGLALHGFEFKSYRGDWLRERGNPAKAEAVAQHCDRWFIVTTDESVVKPEELPEPWGLLVANEDGTRLIAKKPAAELPDRDKLVIKRAFVAAMLRKVGETTVARSEVDARIKDAIDKALENSNAGRELKWATERADRLQREIDEFEKASGVKIGGYHHSAEKIGKAVAAVLDTDSSRRNLEHQLQSLERAATATREAIATFRSFEATEAHV